MSRLIGIQTKSNRPVLRNTLVSAVYKSEYFIVNYWLPVGYLVLLTGLFWLPERSLYSKTFYSLFALPALLLLLIRPNRIRELVQVPTVISLLALCTWLLISLLWTDSDDSASSLAKRPLYVLLFFVGCAAMASARTELIQRLLFTASMLVVIAAVYNLAIHLYSTPNLTKARLIGSGSLMNPLLTSHVLGFFCAYWMAHWVCIERHKYVAAVSALILLAALIATGSRTPLLAVSAAAVWLAIIWRQPRAWLLLGMLVFCGLLTFALFPEQLTRRGLSYRPEIWLAGWQHLLESLWIGHGYNSELILPVEAIGRSFFDPHNVELAVAIDLGIVGLVLWSLMYGCALLTSVKNRTSPYFCIASALVICGLTAGMTEGSNFLPRPNENWFLIWIPLSLIVALSLAKRRERTK